MTDRSSIRAGVYAPAPVRVPCEQGNNRENRPFWGRFRRVNTFDSNSLREDTRRARNRTTTGKQVAHNSQPAPAGAPLWVKMVAGRAVLSEPLRGDRAEADNPCGGSRPRITVRPAPHRGAILCRPRKRGARVAVSRAYLRRHGRLPTEGGEDASAHRAVLWVGRASGDGRSVPYGRRAGHSIEQGGAHVSNGDARPRSLAGLAEGGGG